MTTIYKKGDKIKDYNGKWYTVTGMAGNIPMRKLGIGSIPIWTTRPKMWRDKSEKERLETRIRHYEYELLMNVSYSDSQNRFDWIKMIVSNKIQLIKLKHCL